MEEIPTKNTEKDAALDLDKTEAVQDSRNAGKDAALDLDKTEAVQDSKNTGKDAALDLDKTEATGKDAALDLDKTEPVQDSKNTGKDAALDLDKTEAVQDSPAMQDPSVKKETDIESEKELRSENSDMSMDTRVAKTSGKRSRNDAGGNIEKDNLDGSAVGDKDETITSAPKVSHPEKRLKGDTSVHDAGEFFCNLCDVACNSKKDYENHVSGKKHKKAAKASYDNLMVQKGSPNSSSSNGGQKVAEGEQELKCTPCKVICNSQRDYEQHVSGKKHAARLKQSVRDAAFGLEDTVGPHRDSEKENASEGIEKKGAQMESFNGLVNDSAAMNDDLKAAAPSTSLQKNAGLQSDQLSEEGNQIVVCHGQSMEDNQPIRNGSALGRALYPSADMLMYDSLKNVMRGSFNQQDPCASNALRVEIQNNEVMYDMCGSDCGRSPGDHARVSMHASCFFKLLKNASGFKCDSVWKGAVATEELDCKLCRVEFGSKVDFENHMSGKKHASQSKRSQLKCEVCNLYCTCSQALEAHLAGKGHASKVRLMQKRSICFK